MNDPVDNAHESNPFTTRGVWPDCVCFRSGQSVLTCDRPCSNRGDKRLAKLLESIHEELEQYR
jgi:hypothetical protein